MEFINRYRKSEFLVVSDDMVQLPDNLLPVMTKSVLMLRIANNMPVEGLFNIASSDVDLSKMNVFEVNEFLKDNPDNNDVSY